MVACVLSSAGYAVSTLDRYALHKALTLNAPVSSSARHSGEALGTDIGMRASAGAGVTRGFMDVPNSVKEFALAAEAIARGVWYFLDFAARCFFTSAFLISISATPIVACLLEGSSSGAKRGELKARRKNYYFQHTLITLECD
jgi:hypothetical protein